MEKIYKYRFGLFLMSQLVILFGSLLIPAGNIESIILSLFFIINVIAAIILVSKNRLLVIIFIGLFLFMIVNFAFNLEAISRTFSYIKLVGYFLFYGIVTIQIIKQVWEATVVNRNVIFGLISGYISLGLIGFFIFMTIELINPNSFEGFRNLTEHADALTEQVMYFSYITLLTIGYGDILPVTSLAQKATILIGLMGQIYLVVLTAIVVGKYINQLNTAK